MKCFLYYTPQTLTFKHISYKMFLICIYFVYKYNLKFYEIVFVRKSISQSGHAFFEREF